MAARVVRPKARPRELLDHADPSTPSAKVVLSHVMSSTIRPPTPAVLTSRSTPVAPDKHDPKQEEEAREAETPESPSHLSPPYRCCTLPSSSQRWDGYTGKHLAAAPPPRCLRLGPINSQSCPPNIWERRWWGCGKNDCLRGELFGEDARTNEGQRREDRHPERVTHVADHEIKSPRATCRGLLWSSEYFCGVTIRTELGKLQKKPHKTLSFFRFMSFAFMSVVITALSSSTVVGQRHRKRDWWYYRQMNMFPLPITVPKSDLNARRLCKYSTSF